MNQNHTQRLESPMSRFAVLLAAGIFVTFSAACDPAGAASPTITGLVLINVDTRQPVAGFNPIKDGSVIELKSMPTRKFSVRADVVAGTTKSVNMDVNGTAIIENTAP